MWSLLVDLLVVLFDIGCFVMSTLRKLVLPMFALLLFSGNATSGEFDEEKVLKVVNQVVSWHRMHARCASLHPDSYKVVRDFWALEVQGGVDVLRSLKPSANFVLRFSNAVDPSKLIDRSTSLGSVIDECHKNSGIFRQFDVLDYPRLGDSILDAVNRK